MVDYGKYVYVKKKKKKVEKVIAVNQTDGKKETALVVYDQSQNEKERNSKARRLGLFEIFAFMVFLFLLLGVGVITYFDYKEATFAFNQKEDGDTFYAVKIATCVDFETAKYYGIEVKKKGGAGFLLKNQNGYDVICAVYPDEVSANKVCAVLKQNNGGAGVVSLTVPSLKKDYTEPTEKALKVYSFCFSGLYDISGKLDKGEITIEDAKYFLKILKAEVVSVFDRLKYTILAENYRSENVFILSEISAVIGCMDKVTEQENEISFLSEARYLSVQILSGFSDMITALNE